MIDPLDYLLEIGLWLAVAGSAIAAIGVACLLVGVVQHVLRSLFG